MGRLPDFIIAGAARSGTTWLCHLLGRHPEIGLAQPIAPEPKFFLVDDLYGRGLTYYSERWFEALDRRVVGEKSTNYMDDPKVAGRIADALPGVRLIFMLRDPVERALSNYNWSRRNGHETLDLADALDREDRPLEPALRYARPFDYLRRGRYADLIAPYLERFGPDRLLLVGFEGVASEAAALAARIHRFLGVDERPGDADGLGRINESRGAPMPAAVRRRLVDYFAGPNDDLARLTGFDVSRWSSARAVPEALAS